MIEDKEQNWYDSYSMLLNAVQWFNDKPATGQGTTASGVQIGASCGGCVVCVGNVYTSTRVGGEPSWVPQTGTTGNRHCVASLAGYAEMVHNGMVHTVSVSGG